MLRDNDLVHFCGTKLKIPCEITPPLKDTFGDNENKMSFPLITFCDQCYADFPTILKDECNLNVTFGTDTFGLSSIGLDAYDNAVAMINKTYHKYLIDCLETNPNVNLTKLR